MGDRIVKHTELKVYQRGYTAAQQVFEQSKGFLSANNTR
jgi:hypothetical protein